MPTTATSPIKRATSPITSLLESFPPGKRSEALIHSLRLGMVVSDSLKSPAEKQPASSSKITEVSSDPALKEQKLIEKKEEKKIEALKEQVKKVEQDIKESTPKAVKV